MNGLKTLVMMQLKDKLDLSFAKSVKQTIFRIVFSLLKFAVITAVILLAFYFLSVLRLTSLNSGIPTNFFSIIFSIMIILSIAVEVVGLTKSLYLAKDNQVLLTMPTSRQTVFFSKMIVYLCYEFVRNIFYIMPLLVAYGMINNMPIFYYLWLVVANLIITLFTTSIASLLSIPFLFLSLFLKRVKVLEYLVVGCVLGGLLTLIILIINAIPENIDILGNWGTIFWELQDIFTQYTSKFYILYRFTMAFVGFRYGLSNVLFGGVQVQTLLIVCAITAITLVATYFIIRPLYFRMASKPFEFTKKANTTYKKNIFHSSFVGSLKKEFIMTSRSSEKFNPLILTTVFLPLAIFLMNKIFGAMDTRLAGTYMAMSFNILLILLVVLSSNAVVAKLYSEEGLSGFINKTVPAKYTKVLFSKLVVYAVCMGLSILASTVIFSAFSNFTVLQGTIVFLSLLGIYLGHMFWSASLDIMNPQTEQYATTGTHTSNPNETKSTLIAFLISAVITFVFYFLITENAQLVFAKIFGIALLYFAWNLYMYLSKIKTFFKEK
ncbi:MAG: hypothetical protein ACI4L7_03375 [Christensenellales bacterium]